VVWGLAAVLLLVLWARSYWYVDDLVLTLTKTRKLELQSVPARCIGFIAYAPSRPISSFARYMSTTPEGAEHAHLKHGVLGGEWAMSTAWVAHWILAAVFLLLSVAPWIRQLRLRYSLRTLLIATTLVALALGLAVWAIKT
jgi:hypothetical protein